MSKINLINATDYDYTVTQLKGFFRDRGFVEVPVQHRLSILAACENPFNIATFNYAGQLWPLPQTGQMWLEYELLRNPNDARGYYCVSTSYRQEPEPVPGRHDLIFPMFEFETFGDINDLIRLEQDLLKWLGFDNREVKQDKPWCFAGYDWLARHYGIQELTDKEETKIGDEFGPVCFIMQFPEYTSPFWNMKRNENHANKVDVLLYGMETIGSAERSTDAGKMRESFYSISNGMYAQTLFGQFGKERVQKELEDFLALPMVPRCGGGIGITRMIRALKLAKKL